MNTLSPGDLVLALALELQDFTPEARKARLAEMRSAVEAGTACDCPACSGEAGGFQAASALAIQGAYAGPVGEA